MLLFTRHPSQRAVIVCPGGEQIWLTMRDGYIDCERAGIIDVATERDAVYYDIGQDTIEIVFNYAPRWHTKQGNRIGIQAPLEFVADREEVYKRKLNAVYPANR
jgi:hypothetical protein